ncbi:hypothetical protein E3P81_00137 [Wallemia ichthyophaga]|nr:hypothetical protein E3P97_00030 [Wallemia ichthyophaga]TIB36217.1 hypothetical protein E3P85_00138 [Wallemia ichthyophaga]TIB51470.1 hypothetical protein E3P82_00030 [Wallemia ichthyophaga]TIB54678.1 hypothetical protein E3P81_00137 [Wallemia ichthyophaga]TIB57342.1 hypothetical protein E3P80_00030 [Wallemia ichthyophaga]
MDYDDIFDTDLINNDLILDDKDFTKFDDKLEQPQEAQLPAKQSKSLTQSISDIVHSLWEFDSEGIFHKPVNTKLLRDYTKLIKFPMDLSTVKSKSCYKDLDALKADLLLISNNAKMYNPPDNYFHSKAIEFESFFLSLLQQESSNYVIVNDKPVVHQSLPIAWGIYSEDEEESEDEDVKPTEPSPLVHQVDDAQQPKPSYQLDVFNPSQFLDNLRLYSEPNPFVPLNTPSIYAKKSRIQKKRLTKKEQEQLEKDPYQKNADGSIKADEFDDPWSLIPSRWRFNTPFLQPVCTPPTESNFRPVYLPPKRGFYFKYATHVQPKQQHHQHQHQQQYQSQHFQTPQPHQRSQTPQQSTPQSQTPQPQPAPEPQVDKDEPRQATVLNYGSFQNVPLLLSANNDNLIKAAYHVEGDAMIHVMSKRMNDERSAEIYEYLKEKYGPVKPVPGNGGWEVFYRNYLHDQIKNGEAYIDDVFFGGTQGKAFLRSISRFIKESLIDSGIQPDDERAQRLYKYFREKYIYRVSDQFAMFEDVYKKIKSGCVDGSVKQSFEYYNDVRRKEIRDLAYKSYLRSTQSKVHSHTLLFNESIRELSKLPHEEIHQRPEDDPAGVLASLKEMAEKVNMDTQARNNVDVKAQPEEIKMDVDDNYSDDGSNRPATSSVFKVVAPSIPKPVTNKRSKRASRSSTAKKQQAQRNEARESPQSEHTRVELLKVALKLPSSHLIN